ncbi:P74 [Mocis latipes granulovirus]|uniref:P74 n=1 Tax=Mocis latipes granulovirus TaxID=2072024 RepID=A0A161CD36_9BBAC|nr:P74 [Mocis latipes granulovirus]AKR17431.1 P74 [Mocis latipes granulovirus]
MALPTAQDMISCDEFIVNRIRLNLIRDWRTRFPNIFINYAVRYANNNDFHVPPALLNKQAVMVELEFSKQGCEAMTCYPFTATRTIDIHSPIGGYTQTSNTAVQYNQPACFNLDRAMARRNGELQSVETRYTANEQCIMVDSFTKMYLNTPYMRTEDRRSAGIDDVPGFDTAYSNNPVFPDKAEGFFNAAYCRRFGRDVVNANSSSASGCAQAWYEMLVGFVLGDSIYASFKMMATGVVADMSMFRYDQPSSILPPPPPPEGKTMLDEWMEARDDKFDEMFERGFITHNDFGDLRPGTTLVYEAQKGYSYKSTSTFNATHKQSLLRQINSARLALLNGRERRQDTLKSKINKTTTTDNPLNVSEVVPDFQNYNNNDELDSMIIDFLEDHSFILGILTDLGFNILESQLNKLLKEVSSQLLPILRNLLLGGTKTFTNRFAAEVYKAVVINTVHRTLVKTVAVVSKMMFRALKMAMSVINVVLMFLTLIDFVLMIWDPYGYNNMFPRGYLDDLSNAFLGSLYDSIGIENRDLIVVLPEMYMEYVTTTYPTNANAAQQTDIDLMTFSAIDAITYIDNLKVNSNGQMITWQGDPLTDIDLESVISSSFAANRNYEYFKWFLTRHNKIMLNPSPLVVNSKYLGGFVLLVGGMVAVYKNVKRKQLEPPQLVAFSVLFLLLIIIGIWLLMTESMKYYMALLHHNVPTATRKNFAPHKPLMFKA